VAHTAPPSNFTAHIVRPKNVKINISAATKTDLKKGIKKPTQKRATFTTKFYIVPRRTHITILHKIKFVVVGFIHFFSIGLWVGLNLALIYTKHVCGMFRLPLSFRMSFCCSFVWRPETKAKRNLCQSAAFHFSLDGSRSAHIDPNLNNWNSKRMK